jgi:myo-inositol-1(or 4)-monophosphatase
MYEMKDIKNRLKYAKIFAKGAGEILLKRFKKRKLLIEKKGDIDLVTDADKKAEAHILGSIFNRFPEDSILAEESGEIFNNGKSPYRWIIDPLDGTTNFAQKFYLFAVSIAVEYINEIVIGVIYIPYFDELYYAYKGGGAFLNDDNIKVSQKEKLINSVIATGFPYSKNENQDNNLKEHNKIITKCRDIRRCGSAAIDLVYTASGIWDGYWEKKLKPWDIAAGSLIVKEAGGEVRGLEGKEFDYMKGNIVAGNKIIVDSITDIIK